MALDGMCAVCAAVLVYFCHDFSSYCSAVFPLFNLSSWNGCDKERTTELKCYGPLCWDDCRGYVYANIYMLPRPILDIAHRYVCVVDIVCRTVHRSTFRVCACGRVCIMILTMPMWRTHSRAHDAVPKLLDKRPRIGVRFYDDTRHCRARLLGAHTHTRSLAHSYTCDCETRNGLEYYKYNILEYIAHHGVSHWFSHTEAAAAAAAAKTARAAPTAAAVAHRLFRLVRGVTTFFSFSRCVLNFLWKSGKFQ